MDTSTEAKKFSPGDQRHDTPNQKCRGFSATILSSHSLVAPGSFLLSPFWFSFSIFDSIEKADSSIHFDPGRVFLFRIWKKTDTFYSFSCQNVAFFLGFHFPIFIQKRKIIIRLDFNTKAWFSFLAFIFIF